MDKEQFSNSAPAVGFDPATALAASVTGNSIDTLNYRSVTLALVIAISAGSVDSVKWQESSDNGVADAWADIPESENLYYPGSFPISADGNIHIGCVAKERYVRPVLTCTGPTGTVAGVGLLQDSMVKPQVKESSVVADADMIAPGPLADADVTAPKR